MLVPLVFVLGVPRDVACLEAASDTTLYFSFLGTPLSNGAGEHAFCGVTGGLEPRRSLYAFDLTAIPSGSTIDAVTLDLTVSKTIVGPKPCSLHRVTREWGESTSNAPLEEGGGAPAEPGDATWYHRLYPEEMWTKPGGDYEPAPSATMNFSTIGHHLIASEAMRGDVQFWLDHPEGNFGWIVVGDESGTPSAKRLDTREHVFPGNRPRLIVTFTPPCLPDCERDADLDVFDFLCFQNLFARQNPYADYEQDGDWDVFDFLAFQDSYALGC